MGRSVYLDLPQHVLALASGYDRDVRMIRLEEDTDASWAVLATGEPDVDGVIILEHLMCDPERLLRHLRIPAVVLNWHGEVAIDHVGTDDARGMVLAVEHLHRQGHRHLLYGWNGSGTHPPSINARRDSYRATTARLGLRADEHIGMMEAVINRLAAADPPTAILTYSSVEARDLHRLMLAAGMTPGRTGALIACNDHPWLEDVQPAVSAMDIGMGEMIRHAMTLLLARIALANDPPPPRRVLVEPRLVVRQTTPAIDHRDGTSC